MARRAKSLNELSAQFNRLYDSIPDGKNPHGKNPKRARVINAYDKARKQRHLGSILHLGTSKGNIKKYIGGAVAG